MARKAEDNRSKSKAASTGPANGGGSRAGVLPEIPQREPGENSWLKWVLPPAMIVLAGLVVYAGSFRGEFVFDDLVAIQVNPTIRDLWPIHQVLFPASDLVGEGSTVEGRPLLNLSFALNYAAGGFHVWGYHAVNLTVHVLAGLLLFGVVRRTLMLPAYRERMGNAATWLAMVVALVWVVHPLQTASVTYLAQRAESLVGLFYLLTMYLAIRSFESSRPVAWRAAAVMACVLGMGAKEVMVTAPLLVLLYDEMFVAGSWREVWRKRRGFHLCLMLLGWGTLATVMVGTSGSNLDNVKALFLQMGGREEAVWSGHEIHWLDYARMQVWAVARYVGLAFWPSPLVFAYGRDMARGFWEVAPSAIFVGLMLAATAAAWWRRSWTGYAGVWFFLILAPTSSVFPLSGQTVAEHRMYLPLAGVVVLVVVGGFALWRELRTRMMKAGSRQALLVGRVVAPAAVAAVLLILGGLTIARNRDYKTPWLIWHDTVLKWPTNATAQNNLGMAFRQQGEIDKAITCYRKAIEVDPDYAQARYNLANAVLQMGQVDEAMLHYRRVLELDPGYSEAHNNLGEAFRQKGQVDEAITHFERSLELKPGNAVAHNNLGNALFRKGRTAEAMVCYQKALELKPDYAEARYSLGTAFFQAGRTDEAMTHLQKALEINPDYAEAHNNLGSAFMRKGQVREGVAHYEQAVRINPMELSALNNLARTLATTPEPSLRDGARALALAQRANQLSGGDHPVFLHTLAAAYAETGRFAQADETAARALSLAIAQGNGALADVLRNARKLYQAGQPMRDIRQTPPGRPLAAP